MPSTDAQHRYQRSSIHHIKAQPITCRSRDPDASTLSLTSHYAFLPIVPLQPMPIPFGSISLIHRITIRTGLFTIDRPFLLSTFLSFLSPFSLTALYLVSLFNISPPFRLYLATQLPYL